MTRIASRDVLRHPSLLARSREPVYRGVDDGPRYTDKVWDFAPLISRSNQSDRTIDFESMPVGYRTTVKDVLFLLAQPDHDALREAGVIRKPEPAPTITLINTFGHLRTLAVWGEELGLESFQQWTQKDADALVVALESGTHRPGGVALRPETVRGYLDSFYLLRQLGPALPEGGVDFHPWNGMSARTVAQVATASENKTAPLPWETWAPLVAGAYVVIDRFSRDIIEASRILANLPKDPCGPGGENAWAIIREWEASGGPIPLSTGFGRGSHTPRGLRNTRLLCRILRINNSLLRASNHNYNPRAIALLDSMAADPARSRYGGILEPTVMVTLPDGSQHPWVAELGPAEVEHLESVLRAACYVMFCALTGMRDSEVQGLERDAVTTRDGLPALKSVQHKGRGSTGAERGWWAPAPVFRAFEVLAALSPHPTLLFARSADSDVTGYVPSRDIPRLIEFINGDPSERFGRGHGLGLTPIAMTAKTAINANSLRRSFSVFASTHPEAELGLGIQLGHAAWRTTGGYTTDSQQTLARTMDSDRRNVIRQQASALVLGAEPVAGAPAERVLSLRAQVVADPSRAGRIAEQLAENMHLGLTNDRMFRGSTAACGPEGPFLGDHVCAGSDCGNSLFRVAHRPALLAAIERIDSFLDKPKTHPAFTGRVRADRARLAALLTTLTPAEEETG